MVQNMKDIGKTIFKTAMELKLGVTAANTKVDIMKE
jgi:hypothetical protein